ncbi:MAG: efflux RND transporter periplasmic adaptor subunit [Acetobacteraceae bacterium]|nr:MAG: efflux RND transporter periplasmic adaptor subunit [Acetobacteraceae bacterium]
MTMSDAAPHRSRALLAAAAVAVLALGGGAVLAFDAWREPAQAQPQAAAPPPGVPVELAGVTMADVPVTLDGLGNVQAYNTVTLRARVDGQLDQVLFTEGQTVHVGDVLARIDPRPYQATLDQAVARKATDQAQLADAQLNLRRYTELAQSSFASRQQVDTTKAQVAQFQAQVQGDQAQIESAQTQLGYTTIAAPIDGVTGIRLVDQGNIVHAADAGGIVVLTQIQPIAVIFTLPAARLPEIRGAMRDGALTVLALNRDRPEPLAEGKLALVDNQIDQATGSVRLKAIFPNADGALWPGQFVTARLMLAVEHGAPTLPSSAIQRGPDGSFVYLVQPDQTVAVQKVAVQRYANGRAVLAAPLPEALGGDARVVTSGQSRLAPGARIAAGS